MTFQTWYFSHKKTDHEVWSSKCFFPQWVFGLWSFVGWFHKLLLLSKNSMSSVVRNCPVEPLHHHHHHHLNWVLFRTICSLPNDPICRVHDRGACRVKRKRMQKNFSPLVHLLKYCPNLWALNLAILPPLPVCRHFSHFKRERRKLCWSYFPTGPIIVTFSMIENRHRWCMWSDIALSNYMIKWQTIWKTRFFWEKLLWVGPYEPLNPSVTSSFAAFGCEVMG